MEPDGILADGWPMDIETMFQAYGDRLLRVAYLMCHNEPDAHDLVQETFCQALEAMGRFRGESKEYTWLYAILRNQYLLYCRKNSRWFSLDALFSHPAEKTNPWTQLKMTDDQLRIEVAMSRLPFKHREILLLRYVEEMKVDEIALVLQISPGTVKSRLHHATRRMQRYLASGKKKVLRPVEGENHEL